MDKVYLVLAMGDDSESTLYIDTFKTKEGAERRIAEIREQFVCEDDPTKWADEEGNLWPLDTFPMWCQEVEPLP